MHVIHVVRQFYPAIGGLEDAVSNLAVGLSRHCGIQSSIVTLDRCFSHLGEKLPAQAIYNGLSVHRIPFWGSTKYPLAPKIFSYLGEADIVHVHAVDSFFDALSLTRHWHKRPMVASTHGGFFHTTFASKLKVAYFNSITRASAQGYDRIIASSESDAAMFCRIAASKTVTIENGVNVGKWKDASSSVPTRTMIYIGRFSSNKNIEGLVKLVAALHRLHEGWRLIVAGGPADITPSQIEAYTHDTSTEGVVSIVSAPSDDHIKTLIGQASYIASASAYEGFGLSIVEGLSAGLTPIVNDIPPFRRLVKSSGTGTLINIADVEAAAAQVEAAHQENIGTYPSKRVENVEASKIHDWSAVSRKFANVYADVLETYG